MVWVANKRAALAGTRHRVRDLDIFMLRHPTATDRVRQSSAHRSPPSLVPNPYAHPQRTRTRSARAWDGRGIASTLWPRWRVDLSSQEVSWPCRHRSAQLRCHPCGLSEPRLRASMHAKDAFASRGRGRTMVVRKGHWHGAICTATLRDHTWAGTASVHGAPEYAAVRDISSGQD